MSNIVSDMLMKTGHLLLLTHSSDHFPHCILQLLVPHAVDDGVHCWRHHRVQNCQQKIQGGGGHGGGFQVGKCATADEQGDHGQVREASGKGFVLALL